VFSHEHKPVYTRRQTVQSIQEYIHALLRKSRLGKCGIHDKILTACVQNRDSKKTSEKLSLASVSKLDISETIHAAACRKVVENQTFLPIRKSDLRHYIPHKPKGPDVCFILDASASMGGKRLTAAKNFVQELFFRVRGRIGIISFQDNQARINVPLTQSSALLKKGLLDITAFGRTPLALGLNAGVCYLNQARARNAVIILVTDGLADSANSTMQQSLVDALKVAGNIKKYGYRFIGIGLKPHQDYLMQLSREAGGVMYAINEFSNEVLNRETIFK
jgi:magnesium chelatase subunit D